MTKPTVEEITSHLITDKNYDEFTAMGFAERFWNYYESNGWKVGKSSMKNWKAAIRTWELNIKKNGTTQSTGTPVGKAGTSAARIAKARDW